MGRFLMLLAVLVYWEVIWQKILFQKNQSEESSKITINAHTTSFPLHQLPITSASTLKCHTDIHCFSLVDGLNIEKSILVVSGQSLY